MLSKLKLLLDIPADNTDRDELLRLITTSATARLKILLGGIDPPESLDYIIVEVSVRRYNRIGSEGVTSHSVEGESLTFTESDFAGFEDDIQAFLDTQKGSSRGRVRLL